MKNLALISIVVFFHLSSVAQTDSHTQTLSFPQGWSLFSVNTYPSSGLTIGSLFDDVSDDIIIIRDYIGGAYLPAFEFDGIGDVNHSEAYVIKTLNPFTLNITGQLISPEDVIIDSQSNLNLISYPRIDSISAQSITNIFWLKDSKGHIFIPGIIDQIGDLIPGQGYLTGPISFTYKPNNEQYPEPTLEVTNSMPLNLSSAPGEPSSNITYVIGNEAWISLPPENSDIGFYTSEGMLVGSSRYTSPYTSISVFGDDLSTPVIDGCIIGDVLLIKILTDENQLIEVPSGSSFVYNGPGGYSFTPQQFLNWSDNNIVVIEGCTNSTAQNFNAEATIDDGSCEYDEVVGCLDNTALNYNAEATIDDGSCEYDEVVGCLDNTALNYNAEATIDSGSCEYDVVVGCIDSTALNYNADATEDGNSCQYISTEYCTPSGQSNTSLSIKHFAFGDLDTGYNPNNSVSSNTYTDNSELYSDLVSNNTYSGYVGIYSPSSNSSPIKIVEVYIDFNGDMDFLDEHELVDTRVVYPSGQTGWTFSHTMPDFTAIDAIVGETRLRVVAYLQYQYYSPNSSCIESNSYQGETEDYTVNLVHSGCTNPLGINYNEEASADNGSCIYPEGTCPESKIDVVFYTDSVPNEITYTLSDGDDDLYQYTITSDQVNSTITNTHCFDNGDNVDFNATNELQISGNNDAYRLYHCGQLAPYATNLNFNSSVNGPNIDLDCSSGCTNTDALNFNENASIDNGECIIDICASLSSNLQLYSQEEVLLYANCTDYTSVEITGSVDDVSPLLNTNIQNIQVQESNVSSESFNQLIANQSSFQSIYIYGNNSISELNIIHPNLDLGLIFAANCNQLESINIDISSTVELAIESCEQLNSINGIGDFDIIEFSYIYSNQSLTEITGSSLSDNYNSFNWMDGVLNIGENPNLNSCCPLGGFSGYIYNQMSVFGNGDNCSNGTSINSFYEEHCLPGCTDEIAINYSVNAVEDDGSCVYCPILEVVSSISNISCITNDADVSVTVYPSGFYNYEWSSGQTSSTIFDIPNGDYSVTVTNSDGCSATESILLETSSEIIIDANVLADDMGQCEGEIITTISGGSGNYTFQWYDENNQTTQNALNLCAGNYLLEVTDGSGCTVSNSFDVEGGIPWSYGVTGSNHSLFIQESTIFNLYNSELSFGDYIGGFYIDESTGELKCGGYEVWEEGQVNIALWGDDPDTPEKDGFYEYDRIIIGIYKSTEARAYFGESEYYDSPPFTSTEYFLTNGFSGLQEFNGTPSPSWFTENTGSNHVIMLTDFDPFIGEEPLVYGDFIGVFFTDLNGDLRCGGKAIWTGENQVIAAWGDDQLTSEKEGFSSGETMLWKVWKANELESFTTFATFFNNQTNSGDFTVNGMSILLSLSINVNQNINIPLGWSMFSLNIDLDDSDFTSIIEPISEAVNLVKNYSGEAYLPEWNYNGIGDLETNQGYQIKVIESQVLSLSGNYIYPESNPLIIPSGWSMISYLRTEPAAVDIVLEELTQDDNLLIFKNYSGQAFFPMFNFNGIGDFIPGEGYQIKLNVSDTLVYKSNGINYRLSETTKVDASTSYFTPPIISDNNMHVVIPDEAWNDNPIENSEISVFDQFGDLVGCSKYTSPVSVITLWGDDKTTLNKDGLFVNEVLKFKIWDTKTTKEFVVDKWSEGTSSYSVNGVNVAENIEMNHENYDLNSINRSLVKTINVLGQEVNEEPFQSQQRLLFRVYSDGSVEKFITKL